MENSKTVAARTVVTGLDLSLFKKARSYCTSDFGREYWMIYRGPASSESFERFIKDQAFSSRMIWLLPRPLSPFLPSVTGSNLLLREGGESGEEPNHTTSEKTWSSIQNSILLGFGFLAYLPSAQCWNLADFRNSVADFRNNVQMPAQRAAKPPQRDSKSEPSSYKVVCFRLSSLIAYTHYLPLFTCIKFHKNLKENIWISVYLKVGTNEKLGGVEKVANVYVMVSDRGDWQSIIFSSLAEP